MVSCHVIFYSVRESALDIKRKHLLVHNNIYGHEIRIHENRQELNSREFCLFYCCVRIHTKSILNRLYFTGKVLNLEFYKIPRHSIGYLRLAEMYRIYIMTVCNPRNAEPHVGIVNIWHKIIHNYILACLKENCINVHSYVIILDSHLAHLTWENIWNTTAQQSGKVGKQILSNKHNNHNKHFNIVIVYQIKIRYIEQIKWWINVRIF